MPKIPCFIKRDWINFQAVNFVNFITFDGIDWDFIPPKSCHFGGLKKADIISVKHLLNRTTENRHFTFAEFETIMIQVEGILNLCQLTPLSNNSENFHVLFAGNFLIGIHINSKP